VEPAHARVALSAGALAVLAAAGGLAVLNGYDDRADEDSTAATLAGHRGMVEGTVWIGCRPESCHLRWPWYCPRAAPARTAHHPTDQGATGAADGLAATSAALLGSSVMEFRRSLTWSIRCSPTWQRDSSPKPPSDSWVIPWPSA
jgi:hypothetical protein